jgi:hypothetical protein
MNTERINTIIKDLELNKIKVNPGTVSTHSLFTIGGTVSKKEVREYFKNSIQYNLYGRKAIIKTIMLVIKDGYLIINGSSYEIKSDLSYEYSFKVNRKDKSIAAINGEQGLIKLINDFNKPDSAFNTWFFSVLENL